MRFLAVFLLLQALAWPSAALAGQTYTIGVENIQYYPMYNWGQGEYTGFSSELLTTFGQDAGYDFVFKPFPVKRLFSEFLGGKVDFKYPDNPFWRQDLKEGKNIVYSDPVLEYIDGVMVLPANKGNGLDRLKTLGTVMGFTAWDYLGLAKEGKVKISENNNLENLLKMTMAGRTDGAYANVAVARYNLSKTLNKPNGLVFDPELPHTKSNYLLSTLSHPEVIEKFNAWLAANTDKVQALKTKYKVTLD
jgi:ABC-type amino acid transport substrate-binding protein